MSNRDGRCLPRYCVAMVLACLSAAQGADRPNIILLMGDDHGWEETGYNNHPHLKTPVLDEMAANGLRLENFYAGHPSCSPTRASFLTGRHPNRMGTFAPGWSFRPEEITSAHILRKAGCQCGHFGKWHLGAVKAAAPVNPGAMGLQEWVSHDNFFELNPSLSRNGAPPEVIQGESSEARQELFDLQTDPAERNNLIDQQTAAAEKLQARLRHWQQSVLNSLTGADYQ